MVIQHLKQIGKVKKLAKWMPHGQIKNKNYHCLECFLLSFYATIMNHFSMGLCHMMKSRLYMTTGNDQLSVDWEGAPKHFPKPNLYQKMVMITVWWSAAGLIHYSFLSSFFFFSHYSFLNLGKIITSEKYIQQQINEMHQKLQWLQLALVNRKKRPNYSPQQCQTTCCTTNASKVE